MMNHDWLSRRKNFKKGRGPVVGACQPDWVRGAASRHCHEVFAENKNWGGHFAIYILNVVYNIYIVGHFLGCERLSSCILDAKQDQGEAHVTGRRPSRAYARKSDNYIIYVENFYNY